MLRQVPVLAELMRAHLPAVVTRLTAALVLSQSGD
jgi:hypothetical protein